MKKLLILGLVIVAGSLLAGSILPRKHANRPTSTDTAITKPTPPVYQSIVNHKHETTARVPAHYQAAPPPNSLRGTVAPAVFTGNIRLAYQAAKDIPEILAQLPCYCHCDTSEGHKSLHSCFEDEHGANCGVCIGEALMAHNLQRQGLKAAEIRNRVIRAYGDAKH